MRALFTGYAPVHFLCFKPLYDRLTAMAGVRVEVSGGLRTKDSGGSYSYDHAAMYRSFGLPQETVLAVSDLTERDYDVLFSANTRRIEPRRAEKTIQIFHGMSFRNRAIRPETKGADHYFLLGPYMRRGFEEAGILEPGDGRMVEVGFPKTDPLVDGSLDRESQLARLQLTGNRPVILYAPTGEKRNSLETMGEHLIERLTGLDRYDVLVKLHDHPHNPIDWRSRLAPLEGEHVRLVRDYDIIPTLLIADLLLTDASSVANEFALLDRPVVFLDVPELLEITRRKGARLDLDTWGRKGGEVAHGPDEALEGIEAALARPAAHSVVRKAMVADLFFNPGRATETAMTWLAAELGLA